MKILVSTAGEAAAKEIADYVVEIAKKLNADLIALHILFEGESESDGLRACDIFRELGESNNVDVQMMIADGDVVQAITDSAKTTNATLILMGASQGQVVEKWVSSEVMKQCDVPVLVVPHCYAVSS